MSSKINIGASISLDGEKEYRQAIKNIVSEQKVLTSEMKLASAQYSDSANSLEALQKKNEILTKQIDTQAEKVKVYAKAVEDSADKQQKAASNIELYKNELAKAQKEMEDMKNSSNSTNEELEKQAKVVSDLEKKVTLSERAYDKATQTNNTYQSSLNNAEASLEKFNTELNQNEKYLNEAKTSTDKTASSIDNMGKQIKQAETQSKSFGDSVKNNMTGAAIVGGIAALGYAVASVSSNMVELGKNAAKYADDMLTMSTVTGISTDKLQAYNYMAELTDTSMETIEKTMVKNIKSMSSAQKGTEDYVNAYDRLNVAYQDGNGNLLDAEDVYWNLIDALGRIGDETERDSLSLTILGKSAQDVNTLVALGSKGINEFTEEAKRMGAVLDKDTLEKLGKTDDAIQRFTQSTEILKRKFGAELSDELTRSMTKITEAITESGDELTDVAENGLELLTDGFVWLIDNADVIIAGLAGIGGAMITSKAVEGIMLAVDGYKALSTVLKTTTISQEALNIAQAANPIGLIVTALAGITAAFVTYNALNDEAITGTELLLQKSKEFNETLEESKQKRTESIADIQTEADFMKSLAKELEELNKKEKLSNSEKQRMNEIVSNLNAKMPELNLIIDNQTGKIQGNTKALNDSIDANIKWYKTQAAKEELVALMEEQAEAELEIYKIEREIAKQTEIANGIDAERLALVKEYDQAIKNGTDSQKNYAYELGALTDKETEAIKSTEDLEKQKQALIDSQSGLSEQTEILNGFISENTELTQENASATEQSTVTYTAYGEAVKGASEEMTASIEELNKTFFDAKTSAEESLNSQIGLFQAAEEQSSISITEMAKNLESQTEAFNKYKDNILAASRLVELGLMDEGLLGYIESFGMQGAASLDTLVQAASTDRTEFNKLMEEWTELQGAKDNLSSAMAEIETNYKEGMAKVGVIIDDGNDNINRSTVDLANGIGQNNKKIESEFVSTYDRMMIGANNSILNKTNDVTTSAVTLADKTIAAINGGLQVVNGESQKAKIAGEAVVDGFTSGISSGESKVTSAFQTMINNSISNADFSGFKRQIDRMLGDALD